MADAKITALTEAISVKSSDLLCVVVDPGTTPVTKKMQISNFRERIVVVAGSQVISALSADISGLTLTVSAGGLYYVDAFIMFNRATTSVQSRWGLKFPAVKKTRGKIVVTTSALQGIDTISTIGKVGYWNGDSASGSAIVAVPGTGSSVTYLSALAEYHGVMFLSASGNVIIQAGATSASSGSITILEGSYLRLARLN